MPKPKDIAMYVLDHQVSAEDLIAALTKHDALSLLPIIIDLLKKLHADRYPSPVIETAFPIDDTLIKEIENIYKVSKPKIVIAPQLLGGYIVSHDYKMYDNSILGKVERMFV